MIEGLRRLHRPGATAVSTLAMGLPGLALAHGGHADVGALAHPLAHLSFFLAATIIALPALVWLARRRTQERP